MPIQENCPILEHKKVGPQHFLLTIASKHIAERALPGQFVEIKCSEGSDPLLRRPISLHSIDNEQGTIGLLYEIIGKGTEMLSQLPAGKKVGILGPLGSGFAIDNSKRIHVLVGGGMGAAPLKPLAQALKKAGGRAVYILLGARTKQCILCEEEYKAACDDLAIATDDGSLGKEGFVSDLLLGLLNDTIPRSDQALTGIYACGPKRMLKAIAEIAVPNKIDCQISLEERMACGIGACKGCPIRTSSGYKMVCKDGPVFNAKEIVWDRE